MRYKRSNGFILILVVSLIPLIGIIAATLTVNSRNLLVRVRLEGLELRARRAVDSGQAWATVHAEQIAALEPGQEVVLEVDTEPRSNCVIACVSTDQAGTVIHLTGTAENRRYSVSREKTLTVAVP